ERRHSRMRSPESCHVRTQTCSTPRIANRICPARSRFVGSNREGFFAATEIRWRTTDRPLPQKLPRDTLKLPRHTLFCFLSSNAKSMLVWLPGTLEQQLCGTSAELPCGSAAPLRPCHT